MNWKAEVVWIPSVHNPADAMVKDSTSPVLKKPLDKNVVDISPKLWAEIYALDAKAGDGKEENEKYPNQEHSWVFVYRHFFGPYVRIFDSDLHCIGWSNFCFDQ